LASSKSSNPVVVAVIAATVILPAALYLSQAKGAPNGDKRSASGDLQTFTMTTIQGDLPISVVPEANTGIVLVPFLGAVLVFSSLHLFRANAKENEAICDRN